MPQGGAAPTKGLAALARQVSDPTNAARAATVPIDDEPPGPLPTRAAVKVPPTAAVRDSAPPSGGAEGLFVPPPQIDEYRILRALGRGGMGQVFLGHDSLLDRPVAVKFLVTASPTNHARMRFLQEARAIARLQHPNVVAIYRVGIFGGLPYLVSELVTGPSLDHLSIPLPWTKVLRIGLDLARGLSAVHRHGVLHRDLKPAEGAPWLQRVAGRRQGRPTTSAAARNAGRKGPCCGSIAAAVPVLPDRNRTPSPRRGPRQKGRPEPLVGAPLSSESGGALVDTRDRFAEAVAVTPA